MMAGECFSEHQEHIFQIKIPFPMSELALKLIRENIEKHNRGEDASVLDLGNCGMTEVPEELRECVWLETLSFGKYCYDFKTGKWLKTINSGDNNEITHLPPFLSDLTNLIQFVISDLKIKSIEIVNTYEKLQLLSLNGTKVDDLDPIRNLTELRSLDCQDTKISNLEAISGLINLDFLNISYNRISHIDVVKNLKRLQFLFCSNTYIRDL
jgi:internalin A